MKLSEMKQILAEGDITLTKSLGQNFLHDGNQLERIVAAAELHSADEVLEIGPGLGPLTERLLSKAGHVLGIEKDSRLAQVLRKRFSGTEIESKLVLLETDALEYLRREARSWMGWKVVSNLPYSVASPILVELALGDEGPERMIVTLQSEVARRLAAKPNSGDYGVLTLLVQLGYQVRDWFRIPASCFFPEPDVDSVCVSLVKRRPALLPNSLRRVFSEVVKRGFSQRRKMMLKLLREDWPSQDLEAAFSEVGISLRARAETVALEQFVALAQLLNSKR